MADNGGGGGDMDKRAKGIFPILRPKVMPTGTPQRPMSSNAFQSSIQSPSSKSIVIPGIGGARVAQPYQQFSPSGQRVVGQKITIPIQQNTPSMGPINNAGQSKSTMMAQQGSYPNQQPVVQNANILAQQQQSQQKIQLSANSGYISMPSSIQPGNQANTPQILHHTSYISKGQDLNVPAQHDNYKHQILSPAKSPSPVMNSFKYQSSNILLKAPSTTANTQSASKSPSLTYPTFIGGVNKPPPQSTVGGKYSPISIKPMSNMEINLSIEADSNDYADKHLYPLQMSKYSNEYKSIDHSRELVFFEVLQLRIGQICQNEGLSFSSRAIEAIELGLKTFLTNSLEALLDLSCRRSDVHKESLPFVISSNFRKYQELEDARLQRAFESKTETDHGGDPMITTPQIRNLENASNLAVSEKLGQNRRIYQLSVNPNHLKDARQNSNLGIDRKISQQDVTNFVLKTPHLRNSRVGWAVTFGLFHKTDTL